jgi:hypothetical protein
MTITAKITKIDPQKNGSDNATAFIRVYFQGARDKKWFKTDLCPTYRNFRRWESFLVVGNVLDGLRLKNDSTIDADSFPRWVRREEPKPPPTDQMQLL